MKWTPKGTAGFAVLTAALFVWACGPDAQSPVDPLEKPPLDLPTAMQFTPVAGAAFTTYNPWVDGDFKEICKNSIINCNIYGAKEDVWLNGGPSANGLRPAGQYFFAVLVPGGQPDPNDGGAKNLSDDFDTYDNRTFTVGANGEVVAYGGTHDMDSGDFLDPDRKTCRLPRGCDPDGNTPLIRLAPYADTWNPGGVYILAICHIGDGSGYPVEPRDCKYDAFKVKEGKVTYDFMLFGHKFEDRNGNGDWNDGEVGLEGWQITIKGTGFLGEAIDEVRTTNADGYWEYRSVEYTFTGSDKPQTAYLTVCEVQQLSWVQTAPASGCYNVEIEPSGTYVPPNPLKGPFMPPPHKDAQWLASGGNAAGNPYIHYTEFHDEFAGNVAGTLTMFDLVNTGGGSDNWRKAARSLVAAYLNVSWGMAYPYELQDLKNAWADAVAAGDAALLELHSELDTANNAFYRDETVLPHCPISASGW
jgi:hypothetical protein